MSLGNVNTMRQVTARPNIPVRSPAVPARTIPAAAQYTQSSGVQHQIGAQTTAMNTNLPSFMQPAAPAMVYGPMYPAQYDPYMPVQSPYGHYSATASAMYGPQAAYYQQYPYMTRPQPQFITPAWQGHGNTLPMPTVVGGTAGRPAVEYQCHLNAQQTQYLMTTRPNPNRVPYASWPQNIQIGPQAEPTRSQRYFEKFVCYNITFVTG